jgi:uncharacterized protein
MILKILLVVGLVAFVYFIFVKKKKQQKKDQESSDMVECSTCGIYCELDSAILSSGRYYCSKECLKKIK